MSTAQRVADAARSLLRMGFTDTFSAAMLADVLWPNSRHTNSNGQCFALNAGAAGVLLRRFRVAEELPDRQWRLVPEWLEGDGPADERPVSRVRLNKLKTAK